MSSLIFKFHVFVYATNIYKVSSMFPASFLVLGIAVIRGKPTLLPNTGFFNHSGTFLYHHKFNYTFSIISESRQ